MQENSQVKGTGFREWWRRAGGEMRRVRSVAGAGVLSALGVVLRYFTITVSQVLRINFAFLTPALSGYMYGPVVAGFAAMIVDVLGYMVRPDGPFFFGFTLNAFLNGMIYGCWLYRRPVKYWRCLGAVFSSILVVHLALNPLWLNMLYGRGYWVLVVARLPSNAVQLPVYSLMLFVLLRVLQRAPGLRAR